MTARDNPLHAWLLSHPPLRTLAVAESMTGGQVQARVTAQSGASRYFLGGVTAYSLEQKVTLLGVDRIHAAAVNCVSARVAEEMARGVCRLFGAGLAVATTGYAEPDPSQGVTVPFAWVALAAASGGVPAGLRTEKVECPGASRGEAQARVAEAALALLLAQLREESARGG